MSPIFVAIDTPQLDRAEQIAVAVRDHAGGLKLGLEFFSCQGPAGVRRLREFGLPIFLDLKLHDIPNTVGKAIAALAPLAPAILTVHASGGRAMLAAAKAAAPAGTKVVAVTVLTSLDQSDLADAGVSASASDQVARLARFAREVGVDGIVCSGAEVASVKSMWPEGVPRRARRSPGRQRRRGSEARGDALPGARRWRVGARHRPPDNRRAGPRRRDPRDCGEAAHMNSEARIQA